MLNERFRLSRLAMLSLIGAVTAALGRDFAIDWFTVDGGGAMFTIGGDFELSGTTGQPDASTVVLTGGDFELVGGFWATQAQLPGDLNCDGVVDFGDIDPFVLALSDPAAYQAAHPNCDILNGDCNADGLVDFADIDPFVALLSG